MAKVEQSSTSEQQVPDVAVHERHRLSFVQIVALVFLVIFLVLAPKGGDVNAYLTVRSVTISSSLPSAVVTNDFQYNALASPSIGSIVFEYCENSPLIAVPCVPPVGFDSSATNLVSQSGDIGFSVHPDTTLTQNRIIITRAVVASANGTKQYRFDNIVNPSSAGVTTYVRITTHASTDGSGAFDDTGSVAFATLATLSVTVRVPPHLTLCTGITVAMDCTSSVGDVVDLGELSKNTANTATTQFSIATNSFNGYSALIVGPTMTAGNRTIPALTTPSVSQPGVSQFGINLRQNNSPAIGTNVEGNGTGVVAGGYNSLNTFRFQSGDTIASSPLSTEWNRFTISYLVNVADGQAAGRYSSTLTVIATTTF